MKKWKTKSSTFTRFNHIHKFEWEEEAIDATQYQPSAFFSIWNLQWQQFNMIFKRNALVSLCSTVILVSIFISSVSLLVLNRCHFDSLRFECWAVRFNKAYVYKWQSTERIVCLYQCVQQHLGQSIKRSFEQIRYKLYVYNWETIPVSCCYRYHCRHPSQIPHHVHPSTHSPTPPPLLPLLLLRFAHKQAPSENTHIYSCCSSSSSSSSSSCCSSSNIFFAIYLCIELYFFIRVFALCFCCFCSFRFYTPSVSLIKFIIILYTVHLIVRCERTRQLYNCMCPCPFNVSWTFLLLLLLVAFVRSLVSKVSFISLANSRSLVRSVLCARCNTAWIFRYLFRDTLCTHTHKHI